MVVVRLCTAPLTKIIKFALKQLAFVIICNLVLWSFVIQKIEVSIIERCLKLRYGITVSC